MKKLSFIFAALCAIASVGCKKEGIETIEAAKTVTLPVSIEVTAPGAETKIALDPDSYAQTWQAGDEVMLASYLAKGDASDNKARNSNNILLTSGDGNKVEFFGNCTFDNEIVNKLVKTVNYLIAPNSSWVRGATNSQFVNIPETQSGKLSDFGKYSVSYSKQFKLTKDGNFYKVPEITKLYNLCPVIKFNVANELNVRKIVIKGYQGTTQKILAAEKSNGGIQLKIGSNQLYATLSNNKTLTIDRSPNTDNYYEKEDISGDVYIVLAPNFPQDKNAYPGIQWEDGTFTIYKNTDGSDRPYNTCDFLSFTFYDKHGSEYTFGAGLSDKLYSGKIKNLGNITKIPFPIPEIKLGIGGPNGKLGCTPADSRCSYVYEMTTDGSEPKAPTIVSKSFSDSLSFSDQNTTYEVKIKVAQIVGGEIIATKNALLRKYNAPNPKIDTIKVKAGESINIGFMKFNNFWTSPEDHTKEVLALLNPVNGAWTYRTLKLDESGNTYKDAKGALVSYAAKGEENADFPCKTSFTFKATYPGAECALYTRAGKQGRSMTLKYVEETVIKQPCTTTDSKRFQAPDERKTWATGPDFQVKTVVGNGTVTVYIFTDTTSFSGFAWLEQGFESF